MVECCSSRKGSEQQCQHEPLSRTPWPRAKSYELVTCAMLFGSHAHTDSPQYATSHLQVPAVVVASPADAGACCAEGCFDGLEPLSRSSPTLAPEGRRPRSGQCKIRCTAPPPGGEAVAQTTIQAYQRLEQVQ